MPTSEPPSDLALAWLLELFEYQVGDLLAGREPRGGERSVRELRGHLRQSACPPPLRRRLIQADRQYSAWWQARSQAQAGAPHHPPLPTGPPRPPTTPRKPPPGPSCGNSPGTPT
ncbi:hypothetical protein MSS93_07325 [Deinococcus radiodurans]|nr:hypothetical protein MSS93_07325 [Deinococcus radiodurans]